MLENLRRGAAKFLGTLMFAVLILSFALWGIPNYSRDYGGGTLARVGAAQLTEDDYRRFFDSQLAEFSRQAGQRLTRESARLQYKIQQLQQGNFSADLDRELLNLQINNLLLDQQAQKLRLALSEGTIVEAIRNDPTFQGPDKKFSRAYFEELVRQRGMSDVGYIRERQSGELREQITESLFNGLAPPATLLDIAHKYQEERRAIVSFTLDPAKQPKVADPDEAKLKEHYEATKRQYVTPETRKIAVLVLTRDDIKERAKVEEAEVKAAWEKDRAGWDIPERRRIQQIVFQSKDAAQAVAKEIQAGKSFLMAALEENGAQGRLDQGMQARAGIGDQRLASVAFALPLNQLSEPVEVRGGGVLLIRVTEIEAGRKREYEEVAKEVREEIEQKRQRETQSRLQEQVEDLRGAGRGFKQIGEELKLQLTEVASLDRTGKGPDGKPALTLPEASRIIASAFEGPKEIPREPLELADGGEAWVDVVEITPEQQKPFETVKDDVKAVWLEVETRKALGIAAQAIFDKIKGGETLEAAAKAAGGKLESSTLFRRTDGVPGLSGTTVRQAFTLPKGGLAIGETADGKSRVIFAVSEIKPADPPSKEDTERLTRLLTLQYQGDARASYFAALRAKFGVSIDEAIYKRIVGEEAAGGGTSPPRRR